MSSHAARRTLLTLLVAGCARPSPDELTLTDAPIHAELPFEVQVAPEAPDEAPDELEAPSPEARVERVEVVAPPPPSAAREAEYSEPRRRSVVELQRWREVQTATDGDRQITLVNLNPAAGEWYLLQLAGPSGERSYHLEARDTSLEVSLDPGFSTGLTLDGEGCSLWGDGELEAAAASGLPFAPLCGGRLALRNPTEGRRTALEWGTDFLRDNVWKGDQLTNLVKGTFYRDGDRISAELVTGLAAPPAPEGAPAPARLSPEASGAGLPPVDLGLPLEGVGEALLAGHWYTVEDTPGVFVSAAQPGLADPGLVRAWGDRVHPLDAIEGGATVYLVAFDLDRHVVSFDVGTDHPRLGWSESSLPSARITGLPGPDGFDTLSPLVRTGLVNPARLPRLVSTFTGGFKRSHGAFSQGALAGVNAGSHYGWVEHGVVESRPQPGLSTLIVWMDGAVELRTWTAEDDEALWRVRHLRQNGVPLVEPGPDGEPRPGALITRWGEGNWSGSVEGRLRSARASLCVQESEQGRFLIYGYFSNATPSAMALTLASYGCTSAMLTDMNALEHTYLSLHHYRRGDYTVRHLITGMAVIDRSASGVYLPRFVAAPDNRDFFSVWRAP
jgi:hypothetical protein